MSVDRESAPNTGNESGTRVREQYNRFPYPPVPWLAIPRRGEGQGLRFELGTRLAFGASHSHAGIRILVAGAGTLEALVVAQTHPLAREVVAVDLSRASLRRLRSRLRVHRFARPFSRLAPLTCVEGDLLTWEPEGRFDYILASNLLQHVEDPAALFARLAGWLDTESLLRVVTYPKASRVWMRATSRYLREQGLSAQTSGLVRESRVAISKLAADDPIRSCFESQPETGTEAGLVDAFFNACENPLSPLEWREASARAGLELVADTQTESSRSDFLSEILPPTAPLSRWEKLEVLDDLLELCANPVLWLKKKDTLSPPEAKAHAAKGAEALPEDWRAEIGQGLRRAEPLLAKAGLTLEDAHRALREKVGPRVSAPRRGRSRPLPGLSLAEYELTEFGF